MLDCGKMGDDAGRAVGMLESAHKELCPQYFMLLTDGLGLRGSVLQRLSRARVRSISVDMNHAWVNVRAHERRNWARRWRWHKDAGTGRHP